MAIWKKRKGAVGTASADQIDPDDETSLTGPIEGDRGIPPVNQRTYRSRGQVIGIGVAIALMLGLMWIINRPSDAPVVAKNDPMATKTQRFDEGRTASTSLAPAQPAMPPAPQPFEPPKPPAPDSGAGNIQIVPKIDGAKGPQSGATGQRPRELTPLEKRMRSKTVIFEERAVANAASTTAAAPSSMHAIPGLPGLFTDGSTRLPGLAPASFTPPATQAQTSGGGPAPNAGGGSQRSATSDANSQFVANSGGSDASDSSTGDQRNSSGDEGGVGQLLRPTRLEGASASRFPNRTLMMARGKLIDCVLDTAISTVVAGMTKCSLTRDVYSEDGRVVLMDRGTELTGEYRSNLRPGQSRLGIVWVRAKTPAGVVIELSSPATDSLGRAGVDGYVERHFWERYGAAILLSSLDDALSIIANRASSNDSIFIPPNSTRTGRDAAAVALENNIRIPPTIIKNQGEHVAVFVARDLDFRSVYGYRAAASASN